MWLMMLTLGEVPDLSLTGANTRPSDGCLGGEARFRQMQNHDDDAVGSAASEMCQNRDVPAGGLHWSFPQVALKLAFGLGS